jgi:apolipoprotein N-acyltransferase
MIRNPTARYVWMSDIILPVLVVIGLFANGMSRIRHATDATDSIRVTFIQPAVPQTMIWDSSANTNRFNQLLALTESALTNKTDLLLWPEAALPELTDESFAAITNLIQRHGVWMIFCTDDVMEKAKPTRDSRYDVFNAAYLFNPAGQFAASYHKQQLVIFGEYVPFSEVLPFMKRLTPITGSYTSGKRITQFQAGKVKAAPLICFEDTFPHHVRDHVDGETDFMVNLTNDGWFGEKASQWQHLASAAFRAVENGIPLLRCCNTGVTCWVDECGRMRENLRDGNGNEYAAGVVTWEIPVANDGSRARTFYNQHGDWFGWGCVVVSAIPLLAAVRRSKK